MSEHLTAEQSTAAAKAADKSARERLYRVTVYLVLDPEYLADDDATYDLAEAVGHLIVRSNDDDGPGLSTMIEDVTDQPTPQVNIWEGGWRRLAAKRSPVPASPERTARMVTLRRAGVSVADIAKVMDLSVARVSQILTANRDA